MARLHHRQRVPPAQVNSLGTWTVRSVSRNAPPKRLYLIFVNMTIYLYKTFNRKATYGKVTNSTHEPAGILICAGEICKYECKLKSHRKRQVFLTITITSMFSASDLFWPSEDGEWEQRRGEPRVHDVIVLPNRADVISSQAWEHNGTGTGHG